MTKIAIQLFGHMRTFKQCKQSLFEKLIANYDCDIFIHTWDTIDHNTKTWHDFHITGKTADQKNLHLDIERIYLPKGIKIEHQKPIDMGTVTSQEKTISLFGIKSMLYSMTMANNIRQQYEHATKTKYDLILCTRPDIILKRPLILTDYIDKSLSGKILYTAGSYKNKNRLNDWRYIGASDVLFFAYPHVIDFIFENIDQVMQQMSEPETTQYGPEYSFIWVLQNLGINVFLINYLWGTEFEILRPKQRNLLRRILNT